MTKMSLLPLLVVVFLIPLTTAEIKNFQITADSRSMILFDKFGFTRFGHVTISVSSVSFTSSDPSRLGFFLLSDKALTNKSKLCILDSHLIHSLFTFKDLISPKHSFNVTTPNEYSLYFANCHPQTQVTMHVTTQIYNLNGATKDYLPAGQTQLPLLYLAFAAAYLVFLQVWMWVYVRHSPLVRPIHLWMVGLILIKVLNLLCAAEDKFQVKFTGTPHGFDVLFYISHFITVTLLFTFIVLIGAGWYLLKPLLQERAKKVLIIVIPLQVLANVVFPLAGGTGPLYRVFLAIEFVCCCAILFPIVYSIISLWATDTDARNLAMFTLFKMFFILVTGYLCFTRLALFWLRTISPYQYQWVSNAVEEIGSLAFYGVIFYMFRPVESNLYLLTDEQEEEATAQQIPKHKQFEP